MFGKKQEYTKELEEKLNTARAQLENLQGRLKQVENSSRQMQPFFESQIIAQSDMDKELAKAEDKAREAMETGSENGQAYEQFAIEFTSMRGQLEEEEHKKKELQNVIGRQRKQLDVLAEAKQQTSSWTGQMQQEHSYMAEGIQQIYEQLGRMREFAKQMGALALNCAIEAGRLGESGRQFVGAAEDVRQLSGSYEHAVEAVNSRLDEINEHFQQAAGQTAGLAEALKQEGKSLSHLCKIQEEAEELCIQTTNQAYSEKALALTAILKKMSQNHDSISSLQHQSLSGIQLIGASLKDEQEARKDMERIFEQIEQSVQH